MSYYNRFRGNYDTEVRRIEARRQALINQAKGLEPENIDELLSADPDSEICHELEWVEIPNPWESEDGIPSVLVRPVILSGKGSDEDAREKSRFDKGAWKLIIEGRLPTGEEITVGDLSFFHRDGQLKHEPLITINMGHNDNPIGYTRWDSADAEFFLRLAESALDSQPE